MDLNKLRIFQMIQSALAKKGITCTVDSVCVDDKARDCGIFVHHKNSGIIESFMGNDVTESELLEWHAEIERV